LPVDLAEGDSMNSSPTLQDFVLNLIYDPGARSAFELDPEHALQGAGLGDVTAADVQAVIPLVVDYAPAVAGHGVAGLVAAGDLTTGVADLDVAGAVAHLQSITAQATATLSTTPFTGELNVVASAVTVTSDSLLSGGLLPGADLGLSGIAQVPALSTGAGAELSVDHDPAVNLDAGVVAPVGATVTDVVSTTDHLLPHGDAGTIGTLDSTVNTVTGLPAAVGLGDTLDLDGLGVHGATSSIVGSLTGPDGVTGVLHDPAGVLHDPVEHVHGTVAGVGHTVSGLDDGLLGGIGHPAEPAEDHGLLGGVTDLHF
jgi:hypothetical protein